MAAGLLRAHLEARSDAPPVESAGLLSAGMPPPREVVDVMAAVGIDLSDHRSRMVTAPMVANAAVIVGMTRQHLVELTLMAPQVWDRMFTISELVRRATAVAARGRSESIEDWIGRVHAGRARSGVLSLPLSEDIDDPMGGRLRAYQRTRDHLSRLVDQLAAVLSPA
jgi:protein-tyrosine-phosphatase